ncbi:MAG: exodeoxyribonuclease VII large subunit [Nitratireductor sp.]|nr:exodeoxyribonuclease VII large subunit [Nitratireductor sp.]
MDSEATKSNAAEFSVSEISGALKRMVEDNFGHVRVRGEITGYRGPHSSGHMYFALKDERARIEAVVWRGVAGRLKHRPEEGMEVVATGKLTTYPGSSKYQIVIDNLEPAGAGALMALLEERKKKLQAEGLFDPARKQLLPYMPRVIGVITSPTGAVIRDILHRITDRFPLHVIVWPVRVQGDTCAQEVAAAIDGFNAIEAGSGIPRPDLLIVARGGGSIEDLWGFNEEAPVRAAAQSDIPVISAVGHETDWSLIDLAADVRAPTPTGAAEIAVPVKVDLEAHLATLSARQRNAISRHMSEVRGALTAAGRGLPSPDSLFAVKSQRLDRASSRAEAGFVRTMNAKRVAYENRAGKLSPSLLRNRIAGLGHRLDIVRTELSTAQSRMMERRKSRLASARLSSGMLLTAANQARRSLNDLARRMDQTQKLNLQQATVRLDSASRLLNSFSYTSILERGFAVVRDMEGQVTTRSAAIVDGGAYELEFADGRTRVTAGAGTEKAARPSASREGKGARQPAASRKGQPGLFDDAD